MTNNTPKAEPTFPPQSFGASIRKAFTQQAVGRIASTVLSFAAVAITSRYLGPSSYGQLTAALAFAGLFTAFSDFGRNTVVARRAAQGGEHDVRYLVRASVGISLGMAIPIVVVMMGAAILTYGGQNFGTALFIIGLVPYILFYSFASSFTPIFQAVNNFKPLAWADGLSALVTLAGSVMVASLHGPAIWYVIVTNIAALARLLVIVGAQHTHGSRKPVWKWDLWKSVIWEAMPIGLAGAVGVIYYRIDTVLLSVLSTNDEVGLYSLAYRVIFVLMAIPALLLTGSFFSLAETGLDDEGTRRKTNTLLKLMMALTVPFVVGGCLVSQQLVELIGGSAFGDAGDVLVLLLLATGITSLNTTLGSVLTARHQQRSVLLFGCLSLAINVVALLVLIPTMGAAGAGAALLIAEAVALVVVLVYMRRLVSIFTVVRSSLDIVGAVVVMALVVVVTAPFGVLVSVPLGAAFYLGVLLLITGLRKRRDLMAREASTSEGHGGSLV